MILRTVAARHAKSQIRAASSTGDGFELLEAIDAEKEPTLLPVKERLCSDCTNAHNPMKHSNSQDRPPTLVLTGANAKVSENKARKVQMVVIFFKSLHFSILLKIEV